ncbi:hypothetical protein EDC04DRAFT_2709081 [Pisolithus marmoratus]|nr:hypothetical protein EDC04DRAFT_2709081 [Pisolithus marmoratus]
MPQSLPLQLSPRSHRLQVLMQAWRFPFVRGLAFLLSARLLSATLPCIAAPNYTVTPYPFCSTVSSSTRFECHYEHPIHFFIGVLSASLCMTNRSLLLFLSPTNVPRDAWSQDDYVLHQRRVTNISTDDDPVIFYPATYLQTNSIAHMYASLDCHGLPLMNHLWHQCQSTLEGSSNPGIQEQFTE